MLKKDTLSPCEKVHRQRSGESITMPIPRIVIEQFPNDLIRKFHINERISYETLYASIPGVDALAMFSERDHSPSTIQTALSFYEIEGVTSISLNIYEVSVTIGRAFDWNDITPGVIDLIKKHLRWDVVEISSHYPRPAYSRGSESLDEGGINLSDGYGD